MNLMERFEENDFNPWLVNGAIIFCLGIIYAFLAYPIAVSGAAQYGIESEAVYIAVITEVVQTLVLNIFPFIISCFFAGYFNIFIFNKVSDYEYDSDDSKELAVRFITAGLVIALVMNGLMLIVDLMLGAEFISYSILGLVSLVIYVLIRLAALFLYYKSFAPQIEDMGAWKVIKWVVLYPLLLVLVVAALIVGVGMFMFNFGGAFG